MASVKRLKKYTCSNSNPTNAGKEYCGCQEGYNSSGIDWNFFVWAKELQRNHLENANVENCVKELNFKILHHPKHIIFL